MRMIMNAYFSLSAHTKQLLFVTFCVTMIGIRSVTGRDGQIDGKKEGWKDMKVEIVI